MKLLEAGAGTKRESERIVVVAVDPNIPWFSRKGKYYVHPDHLKEFLSEVGPLLE